MPKKLITIEQARIILKEKANTLSDQQIANLLASMRLICSKMIDVAMEEKKQKSYEN